MRDVKTGEETRSFAGLKTGGVLTVTYFPDGKRILTGNSDSTLTIWDGATGTVTHTLEGHTGPVTCVAVSADGKQMVSGSSDRTVKIWRVPTD